jgi:cystathionine beta-lyase/cystathionine gamma-synthase
MTAHRHGRSTVAVHGRRVPLADWAPVITPVFQSTTFVNPVGGDDEVLYTRYGNNPNQVDLGRKYSALEGAEDAVFVSSGMAATALAHLAILRPGDHLLSSKWIYGGTRRLFDEEFGRFGISVSYADPDQPRHWRKMLRKNTRALFLEAITNPLIRVLDLSVPSQVAREFGLALLVDGTFGSPVNFRPLEHGADVVITSATKYLNGHNDVIAGAVAGTSAVVEEVIRLMRLWGPSIDPHQAWLLNRGMKTLVVRMERHNANGMAVAKWAEGRKGITRVHYPGLPSHPDHEIAERTLDGYGGMVGLTLAGGTAGSERFLKRLKLVSHAPSLAGVESLISEPRLTSHRHLTPEERAALGFPDGFVRLSCGIEDSDDLIADLDQALGPS